MTEVHLVVGDNRTRLRDLPDNSIDAVVTDPPYGLSKEPDMVEVLRHWLAGDDFIASGGGFMGKTWDSFVPGPATWREVYRVLKPGGHVLAFSGTRTFDMATLAMRLAGFEIRDCLSWMYGQGFPKSMDISKAIDKSGIRTGGDGVGLAAHIRERRESAGISRTEMCSWFPYAEVVKNWERLDAGRRVPSLADYTVLMERIRCSGEWVPFVIDEDRRLVVGSSTDRSDDGTVIGLGHSGVLREAATDEAKQWEGWGTALKPAWEPIILARKPVVGTVAANVLRHGTGALNIDATRIAGSVLAERGEAWGRSGLGKSGAWHGTEYVEVKTVAERTSPLGRFPANVLLSHAEGCEQVGTREVRRSLRGPDYKQTENNVWVGRVEGNNSLQGGSKSLGETTEPQEVWACVDDCPVRLLDEQTGDKGGASRFFYCGKTSKKERHAGMPNGEGNDHPTVKPIAVMEWLVKMVTPPGGWVLDPFCGSGSTAIAAHNQGFNFVGYDLDPHYIDIAAHRTRHVGAEPRVFNLREALDE